MLPIHKHLRICLATSSLMKAIIYMELIKVKSLQMFIDYSPNPILILNMDGQIMAFNHHAQQWLNLKCGEYVENAANQLKHKNLLKQGFHALQQSSEYHQRLVIDSHCFYIDATKFHYKQQQYFFIIFRDITAEYRKEQQVYELATRDMLTGLYNRYYCEKHINTQVQQLKASQLAAFVLIDLNDFKQVNDRYGHTIGDAYLEHVGDVLSTLNYGQTIAARIGGDEFALYFHNVPYEDAVYELIERLHYLFRVNSFRKSDLSITVQFSVGFAIGNQHCNFATLYKTADKKMYENKYVKFKEDSIYMEGEKFLE